MQNANVAICVPMYIKTLRHSSSSTRYDDFNYLLMLQLQLILDMWLGEILWYIVFVTKLI